MVKVEVSGNRSRKFFHLSVGTHTFNVSRELLDNIKNGIATQWDNDQCTIEERAEVVEWLKNNTISG